MRYLLTEPPIPTVEKYFSQRNDNKYILKQKFYNFEPGTVWVLNRDLPTSEVFRTYLTAKILKLFFPNSSIYDLVHIKDDLANSVLAYRAELIDTVQFNKDTCIAAGIPFDCLKGGCEIIGGNVSRGQISELSKSNYFQIRDFEKVLLLTMMLDTYGVTCSDFALKFSGENAFVRLLNVEGNFLSLTYLERKPHAYETIRQVSDQYISKVGEENYNKILTLLEEFENNWFLRLYSNIPKDFLNKLDAKRILAEAYNIIKVSKNIEDKIYDIFFEISLTMDTKSIEKSITFKYAHLPEYNCQEVTFHKIAEYIIDSFKDNISKLSKFTKCLEVETAINNDDLKEIKALLKDPKVLENPLCFSFYRRFESGGQIDLKELPLSNLAKTYKYHNEAAEYFNKFWAEDFLAKPEVRDPMMDEL
jgi:hypothetical protein